MAAPRGARLGRAGGSDAERGARRRPQHAGARGDAGGGVHLRRDRARRQLNGGNRPCRWEGRAARGRGRRPAEVARPRRWAPAARLADRAATPRGCRAGDRELLRRGGARVRLPSR